MDKEYEGLFNNPKIKVAFGLERQGHIPTIEKMLSEPKPSITKPKWQSIGDAIGWCGYTAAEYYIKYLQAHVPEAFQSRVKPWLDRCFGSEIASDKVERNHRFLEEALELVQACDCTQAEAHQLVDYVFNRPVGERHQEVGGVMVTLAALCLAQDLDMHECGDTELKRIWGKMEAIRAKQAAKPKHSPLPM